MAKKPPRRQLPEDFASGEDRMITESAVMELFAISWTTFQREYRTQIPGWTTPKERIYRKSDVMNWFSEHKATSTQTRRRGRGTE